MATMCDLRPPFAAFPRVAGNTPMCQCAFNERNGDKAAKWMLRIGTARAVKYPEMLRQSFATRPKELPAFAARPVLLTTFSTDFRNTQGPVFIGLSVMMRNLPVLRLLPPVLSMVWFPVSSAVRPSKRWFERQLVPAASFPDPSLRSTAIAKTAARFSGSGGIAAVSSSYH